MLTANEYVTFWPMFTGSGESERPATMRSIPAPPALVVTDAVSGLPASSTDAVFSNEPVTPGFTVVSIVTMVASPTASPVPSSSQVTIPAAKPQVKPFVALTFWNVTSVGRVSLIWMPVGATSVPTFETVIV